MSTAKLIDHLEQILPGIQNSNSAAEDAMVEALPLVIAELKRLKALAKDVEQQNQAQAEQISEWKQRLATSEIHGAKDRREAERIKAERDVIKITGAGDFVRRWLREGKLSQCRLGPSWWKSLTDNMRWVDAAVSCYAVGAGLDPKNFTIELDRESLKYKVTYAGNGRYVLIGGMPGYPAPLMDMAEYLQSLVKAKSTPEAPQGRELYKALRVRRDKL